LPGLRLPWFSFAGFVTQYDARKIDKVACAVHHPSFTPDKENLPGADLCRNDNAANSAPRGRLFGRSAAP
jgi:hypothetical protein